MRLRRLALWSIVVLLLTDVAGSAYLWLLWHERTAPSAASRPVRTDAAGLHAQGRERPPLAAALVR